MHTWLALTHAQVPVDIVSEREIDLMSYKVCYLSGPNLTRAAAQEVARVGGSRRHIVADCRSAQRDEYNRPLDLLGDLFSGSRR